MAILILSGAACAAQAQSEAEILNDQDKKKLANLGSSMAASDTLWRFGGTAGLNVSQSYFSNWAAGGQNSLAFTALSSLYAKYRKGKHSWDNSLDLAYGQLSQGGKEPIKTDDRIDLTSKYGLQAKNPNWYYSVLFNFRTQFAPGYEIVDGVEVGEPISEFLAPAFSILSIGFDYKPNDAFSLLLSPATSKITVVTVDRLAPEYGVETGENVRFEVGAFVKASFQTDIAENVNYLTRIDLFSNYTNNPQNVDVNWENLISMKVNKWLSATLTTQLIYDDDIKIVVETTEEVVNGETVLVERRGPRTQFRQVLALGLSVKF